MKRQPATSAPYAIASLPIINSRSPSTPFAQAVARGTVGKMLVDVALAGIDRADVHLDDLLAFAFPDVLRRPRA